MNIYFVGIIYNVIVGDDVSFFIIFFINNFRFFIRDLLRICVSIIIIKYVILFVC